jgi:shikimate kinase
MIDDSVASLVGNYCLSISKEAAIFKNRIGKYRAVILYDFKADTIIRICRQPSLKGNGYL